MNILFVINALNIGGAETFLFRLISELRRQGHVNYLYVLDEEQNNTAFAKYFIEESGVNIIQNVKPPARITSFFYYQWDRLRRLFGFEPRYNKSLFRRKIRCIQAAVKKYKFDLINSHLFEADLFATKYLKPVLNVPHVITMQGCYDSLLDTKNKSIIDNGIFIVNSCDAMTFVAQKNLSFIEACDIEIPKIYKQIYNGLPVADKNSFIKRESLGLGPHDFIIGQVSRSIESKGMDVAVKAVIALVETKGLTDIKLILVGPENEYYENLKERYKGKEYILFPGETNNSVAWCGMFDVGILPTWFPSESCPSSIIEYLACAKPVISTTIGEIPMMIAAGDLQAGILIDKKDERVKAAVEEFSEAIEKFYRDTDYTDVSNLATFAFEKFNIETIAGDYLNIYHQVIEKKQ